MKRPAKELLHTDLAPGIKSTRRLLAYLLRATRLRMVKDKLREHRYRRIPSELGDALIPIVVGERSPLGFYRAVCARFSVDPSGGDSEWGPIEAWLPEGRVRWDRVCAALDYEDMRTVIHESPEFLATFACSGAIEGEDSEFAAFPDPTESGSYRPKLPENLIPPRGYSAVWTLTAPLHHGADQKHGNVSLFRRQPVFDPLMGARRYVPFLSGNAIRGGWRDIAMGRWLGLIGLKPTDIPPVRAHSLLAGGAVDQGADTSSVNNTIRRLARELCPPWDLLAGCTDQQIMSGRARVGDGTLVCRENAWKVRQFIAPEQPLEEFARSLPMSSDLTELRQSVRHKHAELEESDGVQMLYNAEVLIEGCQLVHRLNVWGLDGVPEVTASCLADLLVQFQAQGEVGAGAGHGFGGGVTTDGYEPGPAAVALPDPGIYLEYVERRRDEMIEWAMRRTESAPAEKPAKKGKTRVKPANGQPEAQ